MNRDTKRREELKQKIVEIMKEYTFYEETMRVTQDPMEYAEKILEEIEKEER